MSDQRPSEQRYTYDAKHSSTVAVHDSAGGVEPTYERRSTTLYRNIQYGGGKPVTAGFTHESTASTVPVEWYTPPYIFEALGIEFDLDPCSPPTPVTPAKKHISLPQDGLLEKWEGNVWLNPPYGKQTAIWLDKLSMHGQGVALVFGRTDTAWFQRQLRLADAMTFVAQRIKFINGTTGDASGTPGAGSVLIAYGSDNVTALFNSGLGATVRIQK